MVWRAATAALLVLTGLLAWPLIQRYREPPPPPPPALRLSFPAPPGTELGAGDEGLDAAISPSQDEVVFVATSRGDVRLWRRRVDDERGAPIAGTDGARAPSWRADGQAVAFFAGGALKELTLATGQVRDLAPAREAGGAAWLDDGSIVFSGAANAPLMRLGAGGPTPATTLQAGDRAHVWPWRTPGGLLYVAVRQDGRRVMRLDAGGTSHDLGTTDGHAQLVGQILLHVRGGALLAQRVEVRDGRPMTAGRAAVLATNVGAVNGRGLFTAASRLLLAAAGGTRAREVVWIEEDGTRGRAASDHTDAWQVRIAPDDHAAAITALEPQLRTLDVYVLPLLPGSDTAATTSLTLALAADTDPLWSPDGRRVLFRSLQDGRPRLYSRVPNEPGAPIEPLRPPEGDLPGALGGATAGSGEVPVDWRATAGTSGELLYQATSARGDTDLLTLDLATGASRTVVGSGFNESDGRWSPDGMWLAYVSDEFGQPDVFVQRRSGGARARVTLAGGIKPRWDRDSRALYFLRDAEIMRVAVQLPVQARRQPGAPQSAASPSAAAQSAASITVSALQHVADVPGVRDFDAAHLSHRLLAVLPVANSRVVEARAVVDWPALASRVQ